MMMNEKQKRIALMGLLLLAACSPGIYAVVNRIWERQYTGNEFTYIWTAPPEFDGFVCNTWIEYATQTESVGLVSGSTWITVTTDTYSEQSIPLLMDFTLQTTSLGAQLQVTGQYLRLKFVESQQLIELEGPLFDIPVATSFIPNLTLMKYLDPAGNTGRALRLTFSIDSTYCVEPEGTPSGQISHEYTVNVGIGTEEQ